jgi:hypothetical protein
VISYLPLRTSSPAWLTPLNVRRSESGGTVNGVPWACAKWVRFRWKSIWASSLGSWIRVMYPSLFRCKMCEIPPDERSG